MASIPIQDTYDPKDALKRTIKVSMHDGRAINLGQINKLFVQHNIEITYRISKNECHCQAYLAFPLSAKYRPPTYKLTCR